MSKPTIYGFAPSTYTQTALLVAREIDVDVELAPLEFKQASHLALHPYGKMPILKDGDLVLYESAAIIAYLDRTYGASRLIPEGASSFSQMLQWISVGIDYAYDRLVQPLLEEEVAQEAITQAAEQLKLIDAELPKEDFLCGSQPSLADFLLFPMVEYACSRVKELDAAKTPRLAAWRKRLQGRPSVQAVLQRKAA